MWIFYRRYATADFPDRARARVDPGGDVRAEPPAVAESEVQLQTPLPPLLLQMSGPRNFLSLWVESKSGFPHGGRTDYFLSNVDWWWLNFTIISSYFMRQNLLPCWRNLLEQVVCLVLLVDSWKTYRQNDEDRSSFDEDIRSDSLKTLYQRICITSLASCAVAHIVFRSKVYQNESKIIQHDQFINYSRPMSTTYHLVHTSCRWRGNKSLLFNAGPMFTKMDQNWTGVLAFWLTKSRISNKLDDIFCYAQW